MNVLELFSGTESFSKEARKRGHETFTIDNGPTFKPSLVYDLELMPCAKELDSWGDFDLIWASPPCQAFSVASIGTHWVRPGVPKTLAAEVGKRLLYNTLKIIALSRSDYFFIENPRGMMRKTPRLIDLEEQGFFVRRTVSYCQYGDSRQKPTDIWTNLKSWKPREICKPGASCHESAPRGSRTGTQGLKGSVARSVVPPALCNEILDAIEKEVSSNA